MSNQRIKDSQPTKELKITIIQIRATEMHLRVRLKQTNKRSEARADYKYKVMWAAWCEMSLGAEPPWPGLVPWWPAWCQAELATVAG